MYRLPPFPNRLISGRGAGTRLGSIWLKAVGGNRFTVGGETETRIRGVGGCPRVIVSWDINGCFISRIGVNPIGGGPRTRNNWFVTADPGVKCPKPGNIKSFSELVGDPVHQKDNRSHADFLIPLVIRPPKHKCECFRAPTRCPDRSSQPPSSTPSRTGRRTGTHSWVKAQAPWNSEALSRGTDLDRNRGGKREGQGSAIKATAREEKQKKRVKPQHVSHLIFCTPSSSS